MAKPSLVKLRIDTAAPKLVKSKIDNDELRKIVPKIDTALPMRTKDLSDNADPRLL